MKSVVLIVALLIGGISFGQVLDNSKGAAFTDAPYFNTPFIKASKIKEIRGTYTFKKQGDILRQSDYVYVYSFDTLGQLISHYETASGDILTDTTIRYYFYDDFGHLRCKRINEKRGFMSTYYLWNEDNQIVKEEIWRDIDTLHSLLKPDIERSLLWNSETMSYEVYNGQHRKKIYNSYGNVYLEETRYFDSLGYLSKVEELYTITRNQLNTLYTYTDKGWIESIKTIKNLDSIPVSEFKFSYDKYGNLSSKLEYKKGVLTTEYQVIYSGDTGLLSAILIREMSTNFISIIRFDEPTFWDKPAKEESGKDHKRLPRDH